jgi:23S rRNA pseudouridine1911/1915/1917 synthase
VRVTEAQAGRRLDTCLAEALGDLSRAQVQRLLREGRVRGPASKPSDRVQPGWVFELDWVPVQVAVVPQQVDFRVVALEPDFVVVDKPAGLVVHPAPGHYDHTLVHGLLARFGRLADLGAPLRPGIVHRLDKDTSGLLVVARNDAAYQSLVGQLAGRQAKREYVAIVCGHMPQNQGTIEAAIGRSRRDRTRMRVDARGREALTHFRVIRRLGPCDLLQLTLGSGRTHQIRVHLRHLGRPVLGDPTYGGRGRWAATLSAHDRRKVETVLARLARQALHARRLAFAHPITGALLAYESEMPADMQAAVATLEA